MGYFHSEHIVKFMEYQEIENVSPEKIGYKITFQSGEYIEFYPHKQDKKLTIIVVPYYENGEVISSQEIIDRYAREEKKKKGRK